MSHYYAKFKENPCVGTDASTPLVIVYTALKPRHRRTLTIVIESVGKILFWKKKNTNSYLKQHLKHRTLNDFKNAKNENNNIYLFSMYQFF